MVRYVTSYYDIGREGWDTFSRTFLEYLQDFYPFINLFKSVEAGDDYLTVFMDSRRIVQFKNSFPKATLLNIDIIPIDDAFMNSLPMWKTIDKEREIMSDPDFRYRLGTRTHFPEHNHAEYTLINHCKIDLIAYLINEKGLTDKHFAWVDFGFFKLYANIPTRLLDISKFDSDKITYCLVNLIDELDLDVDFTLRHARETVTGCFFIGNREVILEYQRLYHEVIDYFQNELRIADDDQHAVLQCYKKRPEMFRFVQTGWHRVFKLFEMK